MENITIPKYKEEKVELFNPKNESLGFINQEQLFHVRIQIAKQRLKGYYIVWWEEEENKVDCDKCYIEDTGRLYDFPHNLFRTQYDLAVELNTLIMKNEKSKKYN